jgi:hypothetical protein
MFAVLLAKKKVGCYICVAILSYARAFSFMAQESRSV